MARHPLSFPRYRRAGQLAVAITTTIGLACGPSLGDHPPVHAVKGTVLFKGKPVPGGVVIYEREEGERTDPPAGSGGGPLRATGRIEPDGSFRLIAFAGAEGVPEGRYRVGISSRPPRTEGGLLGSNVAVTKGDPDVLRGRYADPQTSGLRTEVSKDRANEPTFDLK